MGGSEPAERPDADDLRAVFDVYEVRTDGETLLYVGEPRVSTEDLEREVWPLFQEYDYEVSLRQGYSTAEGIPLSAGENVLVAKPQSDDDEGIPWRNVVLFVMTVASTLFAGAVYWYHIPITEQPLRMLEAWPFVVAIMGVLGIHELGHYVMSRYHDVDASLPYFIPLPTYIGSMGAVIRMRGRIPNRTALFDIGVAGPLAGLVATIVVTIVGLQLDPLPAQEAAAAATDAARIEFNNPPLLVLLAELTGTAGKLEQGLVHPVVFGGWVGMLVTLLNLLPVGQLDGGHIVRAMVGDRQQTVAAAVPGALFALAGYLLFIKEGVNSVGIWAMWGLFAIGLAYAGPATPIRDDALDWKRIAVGLVTFVLGALCFTPIPVEIITP
ncbi:MAG: membrane-associated protease RseP (regulator of RpoE activity) [Haloarculaceae archaeon]|jgi:membrane-associated protease RseP (regulator of RpoE activity)